MNKILDLAQSFEQKSKQQASDIEQSLRSEFERHERAISEALSASEKKISADISDQSERLSRLALKTWLWLPVTVVLVLTAAWGVVWWQGVMIRDNWQEISRQKAALEKLEARTWGLELSEGEKGRFILLPKGWKADPGWSVGDRPAVKLEKN